jgi:hypothetical protein
LDENFNKFRSKIIEELQNFKHDLILNSDQTGIQYGIASKRTLTEKIKNAQFWQLARKTQSHIYLLLNLLLNPVNYLENF